MNDMIKSGLVWVRLDESARFCEYLRANNVLPKMGNEYNGGVIVMFGGAVIY